MGVIRPALSVLLVGALLVVGLAIPSTATSAVVAPVLTTDTGQPVDVTVEATKRRIGKAPGVARRTRIEVSTGRAVVGRLVVRRGNGAVVRSWRIPATSRIIRRWNGTDQDAQRVRRGYYRVTAVVRPADTRTPVARDGVRIRVVRPAPTVARLTSHGYIQPVPVRRHVHRLHLEVHESVNQLLVVDRLNETIRHIPIAGNPAVSKPPLSRVADRTRTSYDYGYQWRLPWFVRLVYGRGIGSHSIPLHVSDGHPIMRVADLGRTPGAGAPVSHGCLRMHDAHARWIYHSIPRDTPVHWL